MMNLNHMSYILERNHSWIQEFENALCGKRQNTSPADSYTRVIDEL